MRDGGPGWQRGKGAEEGVEHSHESVEWGGGFGEEVVMAVEDEEGM